MIKTPGLVVLQTFYLDKKITPFLFNAIFKRANQDGGM